MASSLAWILEDRDLHAYAGWTSLASLGVFWTASLLFTVVDLFQVPAVVLKYKVQPGKNAPVNRRRLLVAIGYALANQVFIGIPCTVLLYLCRRSRTGAAALFAAPSPWLLPLELAGCVAVTEVLFYYSHWLLHTRPLYRAVHKLHHEWQAPIAVVAMYAHPVEFLLSNVIPVVAGPLLINSCLATECIWLAISLASTVVHHSGYRIPMLPSPDFHDYHHLKFVGNYGVIGLLDSLHGTDAAFRAHQSRRSRPMAKKG